MREVKELILYTSLTIGSLLILSCLYLRDTNNPLWPWSHSEQEIRVFEDNYLSQTGQEKW